MKYSLCGCIHGVREVCMRASLSAGVFQRAGLALVSAWRGMHDGEVPKDPAWPSIQDLSECGRDDWKDASLCCLLCLAADLAMTMRQLMCPASFILACVSGSWGGCALLAYLVGYLVDMSQRLPLRARLRQLDRRGQSYPQRLWTNGTRPRCTFHKSRQTST
jgi:hypothetical protein